MNLLLNFQGREPVILSMSSYCKENLDQLWTYCSKAMRQSRNVLHFDHIIFFRGSGQGLEGKMKKKT